MLTSSYMLRKMRHMCDDSHGLHNDFLMGNTMASIWAVVVNTMASIWALVVS